MRDAGTWLWESGEADDDRWSAAGTTPGPQALGRQVPAPSLRVALLGLYRAARLGKNVPLLLLVLAGALTAPARPRLGPLAASLALLLVSSCFMTHLNILTDVELDRERKPHLWHWMSADPRVTIATLGVELGVVLGGVGVLALVAPGSALGLCVFTLLTTLYSYNFFAPKRAIARRLKAHWLGHFVVCVGAYLSLWVAGHAGGGGASPVTLASWLPVFVSVSLSEYSLFLSESAIDAQQERQLGLATFARILGRHGSSVLALSVWLIAAVGFVLSCLPLEAGVRERVLIAFAPALLARGAVDALLALRLRRDEVLRARLPDVTFWASRLLTAATLALLVL